MKIYESKLAQISGHIIWTFCFYLLVAAIMEGLFFLTTHDEDYMPTTFAIIVAMWIGQVYRFSKMRYKINEDAFVQYDFQSRTIFIDQIVSVRILKGMKWISFHTPYNMVIETMDRQRFYIAPQDVSSLTDILKNENPEITFVKE